VLGEKQTDPTHSAVMGLKLAEKLKDVGIEVILVYPGNTHPQYANSAAYLIDRLKK
jgi:predicted nuclease with RNAse H fold